MWRIKPCHISRVALHLQCVQIVAVEGLGPNTTIHMDMAHCMCVEGNRLLGKTRMCLCYEWIP